MSNTHQKLGQDRDVYIPMSGDKTVETPKSLFYTRMIFIPKLDYRLSMERALYILEGYERDTILNCSIEESRQVDKLLYVVLDESEYRKDLKRRLRVNRERKSHIRLLADFDRLTIHNMLEWQAIRNNQQWEYSYDKKGMYI